MTSCHNNSLHFSVLYILCCPSHQPKNRSSFPYSPTTTPMSYNCFAHAYSFCIKCLFYFFVKHHMWKKGIRNGYRPILPGNLCGKVRKSCGKPGFPRGFLGKNKAPFLQKCAKTVLFARVTPGACRCGSRLFWFVRWVLRV